MAARGSGFRVPIRKRVPVAEVDALVVVEHDLGIEVEVVAGTNAEVVRAVGARVRPAEGFVEPVGVAFPQLDAGPDERRDAPVVVAEPLPLDFEVHGGARARGGYRDHREQAQCGDSRDSKGAASRTRAIATAGNGAQVRHTAPPIGALLRPRRERLVSKHARSTGHARPPATLVAPTGGTQENYDAAHGSHSMRCSQTPAAPSMGHNGRGLGHRARKRPTRLPSRSSEIGDATKRHSSSRWSASA